MTYSLKKRWSKKEGELLKKLYPRNDIPRSELLKVFPDRTWSAIENRASKTGLRRIAGKPDLEEFKRLQKVYKI